MVNETEILGKLDTLNRKLDSLSTVRVEMMNHDGDKKVCDMPVQDFHQMLADHTRLVRIRNGNDKPVFLLRDNFDQAMYNHMQDFEREQIEEKSNLQKRGFFIEVIKAVIQSGIIISVIQILR